MQSTIPNEAEQLVACSRRGLWVALVLMLALLADALIVNLYPDGAAALVASRMALLLPVGIVVAVAWLRSSLKGVRSDAGSPAMQSMLNDDLRQQSLRLAYRNGLFAVLFAQPLLGLLLAAAGPPPPIMLMASATALLGVVAVVGSLLAHDR
ncbi:hypothetical protein [Massilia sp. TSP1-1-2]|uniref:hypothetical protein n=1 Tax=Massilia sp. TSP1-1-2 TaxID=2804649 RepID=UPI003CF8EF40